MSGDLTKAFEWRPWTYKNGATAHEVGFCGYQNHAHVKGAASALERARAEIDVASSNTMNGEYDYQRGLVAASAIITRLLETKP